MRASEILSRAADLIEPEGCWTKHAFAKSRLGWLCHSTHPAAVCWCAAGALRHIAPDEYEGANVVLCQVLNVPFDIDEGGIAAWNDAPKRTQSEVVSALREASKVAAEQEAA